MMLMPGTSAYGLATGLTGASSPTLTDSPGISQKDTTFTKIFVGGLPYHTTDKSLREHFEVFGEIEEAVVITDRQTSKSRGYGFVTMSNKSAADSACKDPNPVIDGRKANVNLAYLGAKPRGNAQAAGMALTSAAAAAAAGFRYPAMYGLQHPGYLYQSPYLPAGPATTAVLAPLSGNLAASSVGAQQLYEFPSYTAGAFSTASPSDPYTTQLAAAGAFMPAAAAPFGAGAAGLPQVNSAALHAQHLALSNSPYAAAAALLPETRMQ